MKNKKIEKDRQQEKKIAVVTGGSQGIGRQLLDELQTYGYETVCLSRTPPQDCDTPFFACDLSAPEQIRDAAANVIQAYGHIDLLVHNAGLGVSGATELLPMDSVRYVFEVDYFAPLALTQALLPAMPRGSRLVFISSACALFALPYRGIYCAAKAAESMLGYGLRMELHKSGVRVVTICPGDIRSNFTANRRKFTDTNDRYGDGVANSQTKIDSREHKRMPLRKASKKIAKIAARKNGALYIVGAKYKLLYALSRVLPVSLWLRVTRKFFA